MLLQVILEGLGLGALLVLVCAAGIAKGLLGWCIFTPWDNRLRVSSRGYMLGYSDLKDPSVSGFFRFLAKVGDNGMKMQIVKIGFGGKL